jgi:hypothetical protein
VPYFLENASQRAQTRRSFSPSRLLLKRFSFVRFAFSLSLFLTSHFRRNPRAAYRRLPFDTQATACDTAILGPFPALLQIALLQIFAWVAQAFARLETAGLKLSRPVVVSERRLDFLIFIYKKCINTFILQICYFCIS